MPLSTFALIFTSLPWNLCVSACYLVYLFPFSFSWFLPHPPCLLVVCASYLLPFVVVSSCLVFSSYRLFYLCLVSASLIVLCTARVLMITADSVLFSCYFLASAHRGPSYVYNVLCSYTCLFLLVADPVAPMPLIRGLFWCS